MMEAAEPPALGSAIHSDNLHTICHFRNCEIEDESQHVKNSHAFLEAAAKVGFGGREEIVQRI